MTFYSISLFIHIVGVLGLAVALGLEWASLRNLRRATSAEQIRPWLDLFGLIPRIAPISMGAILLTGIYMTITVWGWVAWVIVALAAIVLLWLLGALLTGSRIGAIQQAVAGGSEPLSPLPYQRLRDPLLWISFQARTAISLGIVFLMAVKPGLSGSLLTIGTAIVFSLILTAPVWSQVRVNKRKEYLS